MNKLVIISLFAIMICALVALQLSDAQTKPKGDLILTSKSVGSAPEDAASAEWNQAKESKIMLTGVGSVEGKNLELKTKSVYIKDTVFFRHEWADKNKSMNKERWIFSGGKWTVIMSRRLDTGNDDDLQFNTRKQYPFSLAVFDNDELQNSCNSEPLKLQFK